MALIDQIFGSIPAPLISEFGINATYVKASSNQTYDPETGTVLGSTTKIAIKAVITQLKPEELQGFYQRTDVKIIFAASPLSGYYPQTTDSIEYAQNNTTRIAKIIDILSYRGDNPIMHSVVARLG